MQGLVQVFWGDGKGKTTAALGAALRACGHNYKVHLVQFMKNGSQNPEFVSTGEIKALEKFDNFSFKRFGAGSWLTQNSGQKEHLEEATEAYNYLKSCFSKDYDLIIADEILYAVQLNLIPEEKVMELIKSKPENKELILTGSHKPFPNIFELADLVTEIKKHKHPYDKGIKARKGFDY